MFPGMRAICLDAVADLFALVIHIILKIDTRYSPVLSSVSHVDRCLMQSSTVRELQLTCTFEYRIFFVGPAR